jgi:hypothetical protein
MERGAKTTAKALAIGDRFYKASDAKKSVLQMVEHKAKVTRHQTYTIWCIPDGRDKRYPDAIKAETEVIFLRHTD